MAENTKIEWADHTFNPWEGCTKIGPGCDHCYAEARNNRFGGGNWGPGAPRDRHSDAYWRKPLAWNNKQFFQCGDCGWRSHDPVTEGGLRGGLTDRLLSCPECDSLAVNETRRRVFCASLADWLDNEVPIEWLVDLLDLIRMTPNLDWLLLTKRIGNWSARIHSAGEHVAGLSTGDLATALCAVDFLAWLRTWLHGDVPENVWLGATVVNQEEADRDIPKLLATPARIRFLSMEPLLGPVDLESAWHGESALSAECWGECRWCSSGHPPLHNCQSGRGSDSDRSGIDWVIAGGESGQGARPTHPDWARSLRDQCRAIDVPFLFKQWGEWVPYEPDAQPPFFYSQHGDWIDGHLLPDPDDPGPGWDMDGGADWIFRRVGKKRAGRLLDGRTWDGFPTGEVDLKGME